MVGIQNSMTPLTGIDQNGYAGFFAHIPNYQLNSGPTDIVPHLHEYVAQELIKPLIPGVTYQISFWVSLADRSTIAANDIGMYLSKTAPYYNNYSLLAMNAGTSFLTGGTPVVPQISQRYMPTIGSSFISDKINWVQITGTIVGNGEKWISIGNFGNTVSQPIFNGNIPSRFTALPDPYYYLDNVSIEAISFPITPPTANVCLHGQINLTTQNNLTASWGYTSGSAASFSCNPCSSPTVTVNGASNINAYYHFNGPLYSINNICYLVSNTVTPTIGTISLSATANPQNIPVGGTSNLSVNYLPINFVGIPQYSWTPTTNLNAVAISNPQASPLVSTIYTATVSNANGCSGTTSVLVNVIAPQCDNSLTYAYKTALGSDFSSNVFGTSTIINGANIEVNGLLKVDRSITFNNCHFKMAANSKIIIENSKTFF